MARATANARATIESLAHAWRAYSFCHEPFTSGGTFTHLVSSQLPEVTPPVLAPRSIPPSPAALGLRCARSEKPNLPQQKVTSRYRGAVVISLGNLHNCRRRQLHIGATFSTRTVLHIYTHSAGGVQGDGGGSQRAREHQRTRKQPVARATANARATIESLAHAWRAYSFCHEPFTSGGTFTHLVSSQLPEVTPPVLAPRSIPPSPAALGLRCARSEKPNLPQQKVTSRYRGAVVISLGNLHNCRRRQLHIGATFSRSLPSAAMLEDCPVALCPDGAHSSRS